MILNLGTLTLDTATHKTRCNGESLRLSHCEQALLESLVRNTGNAVSQDSLLERLNEISLEPFPLERKNVQVHICRLRAKLSKANKGVHYISTLGDSYMAEESADIASLIQTAN